MANDVELVAVADYRREDYDRLVALAPDSGGMEKTYDEWKKYADEAVVTIAAAGKRMVRITVDPDEFAAWLRVNRLKSIPATRARYAAELAEKKYGTK